MFDLSELRYFTSVTGRKQISISYVNNRRLPVIYEFDGTRWIRSHFADINDRNTDRYNLTPNEQAALAVLILELESATPP